MSFYLAIISFILSVIIGLVLMIVGKNLSGKKFMLLVSVHGIFLIAFLASLLLPGPMPGTQRFNYFFMFFICSGAMLSGVVWRNPVPSFFRIYFSVFALSLPMFIFSPSMLVFFLLTTHYTDSFGPSFHADGNYFIETQSTIHGQDSFPHYKLVRKRGIYHQTKSRDLNFGGTLDSIHVLRIDVGVRMRVRGYTSKITFVSSEVDSLDVDIDLAPHGINNVEYRL